MKHKKAVVAKKGKFSAPMSEDPAEEASESPAAEAAEGFKRGGKVTYSPMNKPAHDGHKYLPVDKKHGHKAMHHMASGD